VLGLVPLLVQPIRAGWRRVLQAGAAILAAGIVAGLDHRALPFASGHVRHLGIDEARSPVAVASTLWHSLAAHPALAAEAVALAAAAALLPLARRHGLWGIAVFGAALLASSVLLAVHADPLPAVVTAWITCIALVAWDRRRAWLPRLRARPALAPEAETRAA
jgi:hypothetical protein